MDELDIKVLNSKEIEIPISIYNFKLTPEIWKYKITPWEHRKIFRELGLQYQFRNSELEENFKINYQKINLKINELKKYRMARQRLNFSKLEKKDLLCWDIIERICSFINY